MMEEEPLVMLVRAVQRGDETAFEQLYIRFANLSVRDMHIILCSYTVYLICSVHILDIVKELFCYIGYGRGNPESLILLFRY